MEISDINYSDHEPNEELLTDNDKMLKILQHIESLLEVEKYDYDLVSNKYITELNNDNRSIDDISKLDNSIQNNKKSFSPNKLNKRKKSSLQLDDSDYKDSYNNRKNISSPGYDELELPKILERIAPTRTIDGTELNRTEFNQTSINNSQFFLLPSFLRKKVTHPFSDIELSIDNIRFSIDEFKSRIEINDESYNIEDFSISKFINDKFKPSDNDLQSTKIDMFNEIKEEIFSTDWHEYIIKLIDEFQTNETENNDLFGNDFVYPDIYILTGFSKSPSFTVRVLNEIWNKNAGSYTSFVNKIWNYVQFNDFMNYLLFGLCLMAQIVGPIYYVSNFISEGNSICPNNENLLSKIFAVSYFFMLYSQYSNMWSDLFAIVSTYSSSNILISDIFIYISFFVNNLVLFIIPVFTYILFLQNSRIIDLILNCLTGTFLIELDNSVITFTSDKTFLKNYITDRELIMFLSKGYKDNAFFDSKSFINKIGITVGIFQLLTALLCIFSLLRCL